MAHFVCIFHALSFELNFFFEWRFPLNQIFQSCRLDPKQTVHKVENKLKELYEERFWSEISKSSRLSYRYRQLEKDTKWNNTLKTYFVINRDHLWIDSDSLLTSFQLKLDE